MNASPSFILALLRGRLCEASFAPIPLDPSGRPTSTWWKELASRIESDLSEFCTGLDVIHEGGRLFLWADVGDGTEPLYLGVAYCPERNVLRVVPISTMAKGLVHEASL